MKTLYQVIQRIMMHQRANDIVRNMCKSFALYFIVYDINTAVQAINNQNMIHFVDCNY